MKNFVAAMSRQQSRNIDQRGAVSLIASIIISILFVVITTALVRLMVGELRQATDSDQSLRAYYAAEAGAEDAVWKIKQALKNNTAIPESDNCSQNFFFDAPTKEHGYTCQKIIYKTNKLTGTLNKEEILHLDLTNAQFKSMRIKWNLSGQDAVVPAGYNGPNYFTAGTVWRDPAVLEVIAVSHPAGPNFRADEIKFQELVIKPDDTSSSPGINSSSPARGGCTSGVTASGNYNCSVLVNNFVASDDYIIRLKPRYAGTHYQIEFYGSNSGTGTAKKIADQFVTVDVTARAGDVYRRVVQKVMVRSGVASLDYVLFSDTDICKVMKVRDSTNQATNEAGCPLL